MGAGPPGDRRARHVPENRFDTTGAKQVALLASELGANAGNWDEIPGGQAPALAATRFTAARQLVYRASHDRGALPEASYASFFEAGTIAPEAGRSWSARYHHKRAAGHWVPHVGERDRVSGARDVTRGMPQRCGRSARPGYCARS